MIKIKKKIRRALDNEEVDRIVSRIFENGKVVTKKIRVQGNESIKSKTSDFISEIWP